MSTNTHTYTETYGRLRAIDCSAHTEKKNGLTYLSWPWALDMLQQHAPGSTWKLCDFGGELIRDGTGALLLDEFGDPRAHGGAAYETTPAGHFVQARVRVAGVTKSIRLPILDHRNKPIAQPSSFDVNTSGMRCLVKAIALHGLGLYIYAGEDLPATDSTPAAPPTTVLRPASAATMPPSAYDEFDLNARGPAPAAPSPRAPAPAPAQLDFARVVARVRLANADNLRAMHEYATAERFPDAKQLATVRAEISARAKQLGINLQPALAAAA